MKTNGSTMQTMIKAFAREVPSRVKGYVKESWGAPFIVSFMALLMVVAVSLLIDFVVLADGVTVAAYYALVVVLQLICFLKYSKRNGEPNQ